MAGNSNPRYGWMKIMYTSTIVVAGGFGLGILLVPDILGDLFGWPGQDPIVLGVAGSVYLSFACLSVLGLKAPLKFSPVLLLQLIYKVVWFAAVIVPILVKGDFPSYAVLYAVIFALFILGDLMAIPFSYLFGTQA